MPIAAYRDGTEEAQAMPEPRRPDRFMSIRPPLEVDEQKLLHWAHDIATAADRRVAELEARLAFLESQATTDELTGLYNRRGFLRAFARANAAAGRGGPAGVVIICDLDGFKRVNDQLGHARGDETLRQVGALLRRKTRKMDAAARLGGDEFALLLIGASTATARHKCQGIGRALGTIGLGASFGIATFDGGEDEPAVLHRADMAMYAEKRRDGRVARLPARD